ncbi:MAG: hypothetical protein RXR20_26955 [Paraburkholderia sp.]|jgi:hypothetical protein|uniref:IS66 family insertion sequence element accessory protein TnpA n=1 Tax=Paraburkholderia sp. TaxID=1926495 RepID=UPI0039781B01
MTWTASGLGAQQFRHEQGLAVSTFGLWRKKLSGEAGTRAQPLAVTPDAAFSFPIQTPHQALRRRHRR